MLLRPELASKLQIKTLILRYIYLKLKFSSANLTNSLARNVSLISCKCPVERPGIGWTQWTR